MYVGMYVCIYLMVQGQTLFKALFIGWVPDYMYAEDKRINHYKIY